jgi:hypothetical protein
MTKHERDFFDLGDKTGLICADPITIESIRGTLDDLGFKFHTPETPEFAIERIRYNTYDCIVVHENFAGSSLRSNAVLNYLSRLPMTQRRNSFVCLVGGSFKTLDAMQAFAESVHLVFNPVDLPNFGPILKKGLADFESLYRTYKETVASL